MKRFLILHIFKRRLKNKNKYKNRNLKVLLIKTQNMILKMIQMNIEKLESKFIKIDHKNNLIIQKKKN